MNPIIHRELLEVLRTRKALALQLGLGLACALLVLVRWPSGEMTDLAGDRSLQVLRVFAYGLLAGILLLAPAFPATALVREKNQGTLQLLLNSPMSPLAIYLGKLGGVLGFTGILLAMTLPAAAACYALGGTRNEGGITALYAVLAILTVQLATMALLVSSYCQSSDGALRLTYSLVLAGGILTLAPHALFRGDTGPVMQAATLLTGVSPIPAVMEIVGDRDVGSSGMVGRSGAIPRYLVVASVMSLLCAMATVLRLNHKLFDRARPSGVMTQDRSLGARSARRMWYLIDPQRRSGWMSLWVNPVLVKEFRSRRFGRSHWTLRLIATCAILSLALTLIATTGALGWGIEEAGGALVLLQIALLILFTPSLAAGLVASEREKGSWQLLRMTPLSAGAILRGKLMSVAWPLFLLLCATLPGYVVMMTIKPALVFQVQRVLACLVLTAVFAVLLSAFASTLFRSTAAATTASYVGLLTICIGPLLVWLGRGAPFGHGTVEAVLRINPVAAALQASATAGFTQYELIYHNWWIIGVTCVVLLGLLRVRVWQLCRPA